MCYVLLPVAYPQWAMVLVDRYHMVRILWSLVCGLDINDSSNYKHMGVLNWDGILILFQ